MLFVVTNECWNRADEVVEYLTGPRLWIPHASYPDFDAWIQRVHQQLKDETKRAMVALDQGSVIGAIVYQRHKTLQDAVEVKNITVRPDVRGRHLASFLLRNAEVEALREFGRRRILVDAKADNVQIRTFLLTQRYVSLVNVDLYGLGSGSDVVFEKVVQ